MRLSKYVLCLLLICSNAFAASNFPGSLDSYSTKAAGNTISESHINDPQDAIEAIEAKVGTGASTPADAKVLCGNGAGTTAYEQVNLADAVTGILPEANGGTALTVVQPVVQIVNYQTGAVSQLNATKDFDDDDTIPQNDEGSEFLTLAITPKSSSNILKIIAEVNYGASNDVSAVALFQDSTANALNAIRPLGYDMNAGGNIINATLFHYMTAGTTNATTFKIRIGLFTDGTVTLNGVGAGRKFGGVLISSITIIEYAA